MLWKEKIADAEVILLACSQDEPTLDLLKSLAKAIDSKLAKTKILPAERLEQQKQWELFFKANTFRLILVSPTQNSYPELLKHVHPLTPLFLEEPSVYKQIAKKAELWKMVTSRL